MIPQCIKHDSMLNLDKAIWKMTNSDRTICQLQELIYIVCGVCFKYWGVLHVCIFHFNHISVHTLFEEALWDFSLCPRILEHLPIMTQYLHTCFVCQRALLYINLYKIWAKHVLILIICVCCARISQLTSKSTHCTSNHRYVRGVVAGQ